MNNPKKKSTPTDLNDFKDLNNLKPLPPLKNADGEQVSPFKEDSENVPPFKGDKGGFSPFAPECEIFYFDLYGTRKEKFEFLKSHSLEEVPWQKLDPQAPNYFFVPKDFSLQEEYEKGFRIDELMKTKGSGITTQKDSIAIQFLEGEIKTTINDFNELHEHDFRKKYDVYKDTVDWSYKKALDDVANAKIKTILYRPFDFRKILYSKKSKGLIARPRYEIMRHLIDKENIALIVKRGFPHQDRAQGFVTKCITDRRMWSSPGMQGADYVFPLYLYSEEGSSATERRVNMNPDIIQHFSTILSKDFKNLKDLKKFKDLKPLNDLSASRASFSPIDLLDYIYGILHSPTYRSRYKEFLKIDFPRIPYPNDADAFEHYRFYGTQLRQLHLMQTIPPSPVIFPKGGNMIVEQVTPQEKTNPNDLKDFNDLKPLKDFNNLKSLTFLTIRINSTQCFDNVPKEAWEFWIGGYQPAQKWLKDRRDRKLSFNDVVHYQNLIAILHETCNIMQRL